MSDKLGFGDPRVEGGDNSTDGSYLSLAQWSLLPSACEV